jgi:hypothetical protein
LIIFGLFSTKHPTAQRRSYFCDKTSTRWANRRILHLSWEKKSQFSFQGIIYNNMLFMFQNKSFDFSDIQGLHIFASTLSDFHSWICMVWITNLSFNRLWYSP